MHLHWGWAALAALALGAGLAWWSQPASERDLRHDTHAARHARSDSDAGPVLYRWIDTRGVVNIADHPPIGHHYTVVRIDPNRNIIPMSGSQPATNSKGATGPVPSPH